MAYSLEQIDWCDVPLVPPMPDPVWERESTKRLGFKSNFVKYLTPVRWMMEADELMHARVTPNVPVESGCIDQPRGRDGQLLPALLRRLSEHAQNYGLFRANDPEARRGSRFERIAEEGENGPGIRSEDFAFGASPIAKPICEELKAAGYSPIEIAEIAYLAGNNASGNRLATLLALPPDPLEEVEANWFKKLKRPFTRKQFRASLLPFSMSGLQLHYAGPGAAIVEAFESSPAGAALATVLERSVGIRDHLQACQGAHLWGGGTRPGLPSLRSRGRRRSCDTRAGLMPEIEHS